MKTQSEKNAAHFCADDLLNFLAADVAVFQVESGEPSNVAAYKKIVGLWKAAGRRPELEKIATLPRAMVLGKLHLK